MAKLDGVERRHAIAPQRPDAMAKLNQGAMAKDGANGPEQPDGLNAVRRHAAVPRCPGALAIRHAKPPAVVGNSPPPGAIDLTQSPRAAENVHAPTPKKRTQTNPN